MKDRKRVQLIKKTDSETSTEKIEGRDSSPATHVGSSDAFQQTENTASPDADDVSDEKLDEMLDEK